MNLHRGNSPQGKRIVKQPNEMICGGLALKVHTTYGPVSTSHRLLHELIYAGS